MAGLAESTYTGGGQRIVEVKVETRTVLLLDLVRLNPQTTADTCGSQVLTADHLVYPHELLGIRADLKCLISRIQMHYRHISQYGNIRLNILDLIIAYSLMHVDTDPFSI